MEGVWKGGYFSKFYHYKCCVKGVEIGRDGDDGVLLLNRLRGLGKRRDLPSGVRAKSLPKTDFRAFQASQHTSRKMF